MDKVLQFIGGIICYYGGLILACCILAIMAYFCGKAWIMASEEWRGICKAESLIHEYRKNREDYLKWRDTLEKPQNEIAELTARAEKAEAERDQYKAALHNWHEDGSGKEQTNA